MMRDPIAIVAKDAQIPIGEAQMAQFGFGSKNKVTLIGNLGRDPEIRHSQAGDQIANLNVATSESWKDRNSGERQEKVEWHRVVCFDSKVSELIGKFCKKGTKVEIEGALQTRKWTDQQGVERYSTEIVLTQFSGGIQILSDANGKPDSRDQAYGEPPVDLDDEIPY